MNVLVHTGQVEAHEAQVTPPVGWQPESWPEWFINGAEKRSGDFSASGKAS